MFPRKAIGVQAAESMGARRKIRLRAHFAGGFVFRAARLRAHFELSIDPSFSQFRFELSVPCAAVGCCDVYSSSSVMYSFMKAVAHFLSFPTSHSGWSISMF